MKAEVRGIRRGGDRRSRLAPALRYALVPVSILGLTLQFVLPAPTASYQLLPDTSFRWTPEIRPIPYFVANRPDNHMTVSKVVAETRASFDTWERPPEIGLSFSYGGLTNLQPFEFFDSTNTIGFTPTARMVELGLSRTALAVTGWLTISGSGNIAESDIVVNPGYSWTDTPARGGWDFRSMMVHEVGHFLGLGHSNVGRVNGDRLLAGSSIMWPFSFGEGETTGRTLTDDDIAGASVLYPGPAAAEGRIHGRVHRVTGQGVSFAHVTAYEPLRNHLVGGWASRGGRYEIRGLVPGRYVLRVNPIPEDHGAADYFFESSQVETNFRVTIHPRLVVVPRSGSAEVDIEVLQ